MFNVRLFIYNYIWTLYFLSIIIKIKIIALFINNITS